MKKYKEEQIEMITRGVNAHKNYTVIRFLGQAPMYIKDEDKSIYNSLFAVNTKEVSDILNKCDILSKPEIKQNPRKLNPKKDEKTKKQKD
jgi:hypothetical protein